MSRVLNVHNCLSNMWMNHAEGKCFYISKSFDDCYVLLGAIAFIAIFLNFMSEREINQVVANLERLDGAWRLAIHLINLVLSIVEMSQIGEMAWASLSCLIAHY